MDKCFLFSCCLSTSSHQFVFSLLASHRWTPVGINSANLQSYGLIMIRGVMHLLYLVTLQRASLTHINKMVCVKKRVFVWLGEISGWISLMHLATVSYGFNVIRNENRYILQPQRKRTLSPTQTGNLLYLSKVVRGMPSHPDQTSM